MDIMPGLRQKDTGEGGGRYGDGELPAVLSQMQKGNVDKCKPYENISC
jgi:hypothetical protein